MFLLILLILKLIVCFSVMFCFLKMCVVVFSIWLLLLFMRYRLMSSFSFLKCGVLCGVWCVLLVVCVCCLILKIWFLVVFRCCVSFLFVGVGLIGLGVFLLFLLLFLLFVLDMNMIGMGGGYVVIVVMRNG